MKLKFFKNNVKLPSKSHELDAGLDIFQPESFLLKPFETKVIGLGFGIEIPKDYAGMLVPRSSTAAKGLIIQTSVIDPDYSGEIHLIITNCSNNSVYIEKNQRLCSLVVYSTIPISLNIVDELTSSTRKNNGLGSSGK